MPAASFHDRFADYKSLISSAVCSMKCDFSSVPSLLSCPAPSLSLSLTLGSVRAHVGIQNLSHTTCEIPFPFFVFLIIFNVVRFYAGEMGSDAIFFFLNTHRAHVFLFAQHFRLCSTARACRAIMLKPETIPSISQMRRTGRPLSYVHLSKTETTKGKCSNCACRWERVGWVFGISQLRQRANTCDWNCRCQV